MSVSSTRSLLRVWALALAASTALAAAGECWPRPLSPDGAVVWALLLLPTVALALVLLAGWSLPGAAGDGASGAEGP